MLINIDISLKIGNISLFMTSKMRVRGEGGNKILVFGGGRVIFINMQKVHMHKKQISFIWSYVKLSYSFIVF